MGIIDDFFGGGQEDAARDAARIQIQELNRAIEERRRASEQGLEFLEPFGEVGLPAVDQAAFLTDPQAQFEFLQSNPLFQMGLENVNQQTRNVAAARGRLSAGDTLEELNRNALLVGQPLIGEQKRSIVDLLNFGSGIARSQANTAIGTGSDVAELITSRGDVGAAREIGTGNARANFANNVLGLGGSILGGLYLGGAFSPPTPSPILV